MRAEWLTLHGAHVWVRVLGARAVCAGHLGGGKRGKEAPVGLAFVLSNPFTFVVLQLVPIVHAALPWQACNVGAWWGGGVMTRSNAMAGACNFGT